jgi:hypothetical protein
MGRFFRCIGWVVVVFFISGCASVSLSKREWVESNPEMPDKILVRPFSLDSEKMKVDRGGDDLEEFKNQFASDFAKRLAERLSKYVAPAVVAMPGEKIPGGRIWVLEGRFLRLHQGSRALRALVGFGLGGTKTETQVEILRPEGKKRMQTVARLETTGGSNAEPGALIGGPFGAVPRLATQIAASGLSADARRTARTITAAISEKLHDGGGKLTGRPLRAKPLGSLPGQERPPKE